MTPEQQRRAEEIFLEVVDKTAGERDALLAERCGGDAAVLREVRSLLGFADRPDDFLNPQELAAMTVGLGGVRSEHEDPLPAQRKVGGFTIRSVLGEGGMGIVYIAEQERPRRTVALKVIRAGMASAGLVRRFELEAEVLGRLQHPGIAHIFEAGSFPEGGEQRPFIAMELVDGLPLTRHAELKKLDARARMALMAKVCEAVHHAHQRGVIHRDLKPGNILVDQQGQPKVLDFGVARATNVDLRVTTLQTSVGQLIGTLPYMSPEQVLADPGGIDTRSDVYALGVILYQLLAGRLPHDLASRSIPEAVRMIRDDAPARLSSVSRIFRGDIETIVSKSLEKDKERRYQSAQELADDIGRFLQNQPILAKQDSAMYVLRTQLRRYRGAVAAGAAFIVGLIAFSVYVSWQSAEKSKLLRDKTVLTQGLEQSARRLTDTNAALNNQLLQSNIERARLLGRSGALDRAEELIWPHYLEQPGSAEAYWSLWELYYNQPLLATWRAHSGGTDAVAVSPDSSIVATGGRDHHIRLWDMASQCCLGTLDGHSASVTGLAFADGGKALISGGEDGSVNVWSVPELALVRRWKSANATSGSIAVHPASSLIAVSGEAKVGDLAVDVPIELVDWRTGGVVRRLQGCKGRVRCVDFSADGNLVACGCDDGAARLWDVETGTLVQTFLGHTRHVASVKFAPGSRQLVTGSADRDIRIWDIPTGVSVKTLRPTNGTIRDIAFAPDGKTMATGGWWSVDFWQVEIDYKAQRNSLAGGCNRVAYSPDSKRFVSVLSDVDGRLRIWELGYNKPLAILPTPDAGQVDEVHFLPDGRSLVVAGSGAAIQIFDTVGAEPPRTIGTPGASSSLEVSADGTLLASGHYNGSVVVWSLLDSRWRRMRAHDGAVSAMAMSPDGQTLVTGSTRWLRLWRMSDLSLIKEVDTVPRESVDAAITPDGNTLVTVNRSRDIRFWNARTLEPIGEATSLGPVWKIAIDPRGRELAVGTWDDQIDLWDIATRTYTRSLKGHAQLITGLAWRPPRAGEARMVASVSADGTIMLWNADNGANLAQMRGWVDNFAGGLAFSPDGDTLANGFENRVVGIWDLTHCRRHIEGNREYQATRAAEHIAR